MQNIPDKNELARRSLSFSRTGVLLSAPVQAHPHNTGGARASAKTGGCVTGMEGGWRGGWGGGDAHTEGGTRQEGCGCVCVGGGLYRAGGWSCGGRFSNNYIGLRRWRWVPMATAVPSFSLALARSRLCGWAPPRDQLLSRFRVVSLSLSLVFFSFVFLDWFFFFRGMGMGAF